MHNIHPAFVHFPIALLTAAFLFELAGRIRRGLGLRRAAGWSLLLGAAAGLLTFATGLLAERGIEPHPQAAGDLLEAHEALGWAILAGMIVLAVWRLFSGLPGSAGRSGWVFLVLLGILAATTLVSGHIGGKMVYEYGLGGDALPGPAATGP